MFCRFLCRLLPLICKKRDMRSLLIIFLLSTSVSALAAPDNSNGEKFELLHAEIMDLRDAVTDLSVDSATTSQAIESLESDIEDLSDQLSDLQGQIDTLGGGPTSNAKNLIGYAELTIDNCPNGPNNGSFYKCFPKTYLSVCGEQLSAGASLATFETFVSGFGSIPAPAETFYVFGVRQPFDDSNNAFWGFASTFERPFSSQNIFVTDNPAFNFFVACAGPSNN